MHCINVQGRRYSCSEHYSTLSPVVPACLHQTFSNKIEQDTCTFSERAFRGRVLKSLLPSYENKSLFHPEPYHTAFSQPRYSFTPIEKRALLSTELTLPLLVMIQHMVYVDRLFM